MIFATSALFWLCVRRRSPSDMTRFSVPYRRSYEGEMNLSASLIASERRGWRLTAVSELFTSSGVISRSSHRKGGESRNDQGKRYKAPPPAPQPFHPSVPRRKVMAGDSLASRIHHVKIHYCGPLLWVRLY